MRDFINGGHKNRRRIRGRALSVLGMLTAAVAVVGLTGCDLGPKANTDRGQQLFTQH